MHTNAMATHAGPLTLVIRALALVAALLFGLAAGTLWLELAAPVSASETETSSPDLLDTAEAEVAPAAPEVAPAP